MGIMCEYGWSKCEKNKFFSSLLYCITLLLLVVLLIFWVDGRSNVCLACLLLVVLLIFWVTGRSMGLVGVAFIACLLDVVLLFFWGRWSIIFEGSCSRSFTP